MKLLLAIASLLLLASPPLGAAAEAPPAALRGTASGHVREGGPCALCYGHYCLLCKECVDKKDSECAPCWGPKSCLKGGLGFSNYDEGDCRVCWAAEHRCPWMCGANSVCAARCAGCVGGDGQRKGGAECAACWEPNAALQAEMAAQLGDIATPAMVATLKGAQCLGTPRGEDCSYCWKHHAPTRIEL
jgi:hypothetical protein